MEPLLKTVNLTKRFPGVTALSQMNITLETGEIVGLIGPNGSGKTTFMNIAASLSRPSKGKIYINGLRPGLQTRSIVTYCPEHNHLYDLGESAAFSSTNPTISIHFLIAYYITGIISFLAAAWVLEERPQP